jgi:type II secretory pathway pseudopilin PulG
LLELITVIAIIGILAALVYPNLTSQIPNKKISGEAKRVESYLQKARMLSANIQRPVRVVINCVNNPCWIESQRAVYVGTNVDSWSSEGDRRYFNSVVAVNTSAASPGYDGDRRIDKVYYAIYMPDNRVFSDPRPFDIFLFNGDMNPSINPKEGFRISVSNDSGRVLNKRDSLTTS